MQFILELPLHQKLTLPNLELIHTESKSNNKMGVYFFHAKGCVSAYIAKSTGNSFKVLPLKILANVGDWKGEKKVHNVVKNSLKKELQRLSRNSVVPEILFLLLFLIHWSFIGRVLKLQLACSSMMMPQPFCFL